MIDSVGRWAEAWVDVLPEHADPGFALWAWCQVQPDRDALPDRRVTVQFEFPDQKPGDRYYWLLLEDRTAELCVSDPGGEPDLLSSPTRGRSSTGTAVPSPGPRWCDAATSW